MRKIGVGIIGYGYWGQNYVRIFRELPQARIVTVCDRSADRLRLARSAYSSVVTARDCGALLDNPDVDVVVVATPATDHFTTVRDSLLAGKHVLVEKPMTLDVRQAETLITLSQRRERVLMVGHTFLYNPGIRKVKACVDAECFGRVYYLYAVRTNMGPVRRDVNALWDLAPHDISIFNYLLDRAPERVSAVGARCLGGMQEDVGYITLWYSGGVVGNIHVSWVDPQKVRKVVVVGDQRRVVFDDLRSADRVRIFEKGVMAEPVEAESFGEFRLHVHDGDIICPKVDASEPLKNQCKALLESIIDGESPLSDGRSGLDVIRVMTAVERSVRLNGAPVEVEPSLGGERRAAARLRQPANGSLAVVPTRPAFDRHHEVVQSGPRRRSA